MDIFKNITFVDGLLIFIIINLIILYIYQTFDYQCSINNNSNICKFFNYNTQNNNTNRINNYSYNNTNINFNNNNKYRLLMNNKGPKIGFHQYFKSFIPELGWRDFYLRLNSGISNVDILNPNKKDNNGINGVITKNYINQLECTNNVYSQVNY